MPTLKDISYLKDIRRLKTDLIKKQYLYKREKQRLNQLIKEKKACISSGYIQHYPEYNLFIGSTLANIKSAKKELREVCNELHKKIYS